MTTFTQQLAQSYYDNLYLVRGESEGFPLWHYLRVDALKLPLFERQLQSATLDVAKFGQVIASGWGKEPPEEVRRKISQQ